MEGILNHYQNIESPKVKEALKEFINEFPVEFRFSQRKQYLLSEIEKTRNEFFLECKKLAKREDYLTMWSEARIKKLEKKLNRLNVDVKILTGKMEGIDSFKITKAKEYPITNLYPSRTGLISCPFHEDKTPSMDIRKNFFHCYSCGEHGDVIDLVMKTKNITFTQAVNLLNT